MPKKEGPDRAGPFSSVLLPTQLGEAAGELDGELPPLLGDAAGDDAGDVTTGAFDWPLGALPNQSQRVKPKNSKIRTSSATSAAAIPAPAPVVSPLVSTTSEPAGLQYLRTL